jgi:hypothetical protein
MEIGSREFVLYVCPISRCTQTQTRRAHVPVGTKLPSQDGAPELV